jgi:hypothetical protein
MLSNCQSPERTTKDDVILNNLADPPPMDLTMIRFKQEIPLTLPTEHAQQPSLLSSLLFSSPCLNANSDNTDVNDSENDTGELVKNEVEEDEIEEIENYEPPTETDNLIIKPVVPDIPHPTYYYHSDSQTDDDPLGQSQDSDGMESFTYDDSMDVPNQNEDNSSSCNSNFYYHWDAFAANSDGLPTRMVQVGK